MNKFYSWIHTSWINTNTNTFPVHTSKIMCLGLYLCLCLCLFKKYESSLYLPSKFWRNRNTDFTGTGSSGLSPMGFHPSHRICLRLAMLNFVSFPESRIIYSLYASIFSALLLTCDPWPDNICPQPYFDLAWFSYWMYIYIQ